MRTTVVALLAAALLIPAVAGAQAPAPPAPAPATTANPMAAAGLIGGFAALSVADAAASARWFERTLGFKVAMRVDPPNSGVHIVIMENGAAILEIGQHPSAKTREALGVKESYAVRGYFKAGFTVTHLDRVLQALREQKVTIEHGPFDIPELKLRSFIALDPDGNLLQFLGR
jgi:catechol 2,3-dioxygenase-like lactoylglutathione lyase family enzyme